MPTYSLHLRFRAKSFPCFVKSGRVGSQIRPLSPPCDTARSWNTHSLFYGMLLRFESYNHIPPARKWWSVKKYIKSFILLWTVLDRRSCSSREWDHFREQYPWAQLSHQQSPQVFWFFQNRPCQFENTAIWNWMCFFTFHFFEIFSVLNCLLLANTKIRYTSFYLYCKHFTSIAKRYLLSVLKHRSQYPDLFSFLSSIQKRCRNSSVRSEKQHHLSWMHTQISSGFY